MTQGALFAEPELIPAPPEPRRGKPEPPPMGPEVASVQRAHGIPNVFVGEYPNGSAIIRERSRGQGVGLYGVMLKTDPDLAGFYRDLADDVLHYPRRIIPFSDAPEHVEHARFAKFAMRRMRNLQNSFRHALSAYPWGYAVFEKVFEVIDTGEWAGAVTFHALLDKPHTWFSFDPDRRLLFKTNRNPWPGELVDEEKFLVVQFGSNSSPWGDPSLDYVYFPWKLKHHALKNQALWFEKWASPTAVAEYEFQQGAKTNRANKEGAVEVLMAMQQDQALAVPKGMIVKLLESIRSGTVSYESYIGSLTEMESRLVTGQILTSMGGDPGSFALGKVHEKRAANKTEMLATWVSEDFASRRLIRELIVRNYGRQDGYPEYRILAKSPASRQAEATLIQQQQANGHIHSRSYYDEVFDVVAPEGPDDILAPSIETKPGQVLPVTTGLAGISPRRETVELAGHAALRHATREAAVTKKKNLDAMGAAAAKEARPAIRKIVKHVAGAVRGRKSLQKVSRAHLYGALKTAPGTEQLGRALHTMLDRPARTHVGLALEEVDLAIEDQGISIDAKLALALMLFAIAARIGRAVDDAPEGMTPSDLADSLSDPEGEGVDESLANLFEGTHSTNIASIATAHLREQLADPKFRKAFPYVAISVPNPNARLSHRVMDGFILSAEEARYSPYLAPFDFGCDCQNIPISAADAQARGLTGSAPVGSLDEFLRDAGATAHPRSGYVTPDGLQFRPGAPEGFAPAYIGTDTNVQVDALRTKSEELRAEDPEAWAVMQAWLKNLFGFDVLRQDPPRPS